MSTTNVTNRPARQAVNQKMIDGLNKHSQAIPSLIIAGTTYKLSDIITTLQARLAGANLVLSTKAAWQTAVKADIDEREKTKVFFSGLRQALQVAFAGSIDSLADFGLTPRKVRVVSPDEKLQAAAKAKATRAARHTMGKKQKLAITGTASAAPATRPAAATAPLVPPQPSAPSVPAAAPAPAVAPAATAAPATQHPLP
jgi:hypothetical protein